MENQKGNEDDNDAIKVSSDGGDQKGRVLLKIVVTIQ